MHIIACLDNRDGMLFAGRRQSMDRALRVRVEQMAGKSRLWMNGYSAKQFAENSQKICVDEDFLEKASPEDFCFVENTDVIPYQGRVRRVILYRWNRDYPSDTKFPVALFAANRTLVSSTDFPGNSHETITEEIYSL